MIEVKVDMHRVIETFDMLTLISGQLPGLTQAAVQETLDEGREMLVEELTNQINAPHEEINPRVGRTIAKRPTRLVMEGQIFLKSAPIRLKFFKPVQGERGVFYHPYRSGSAKFVPSAFGPNIPRLGRGVFRREGRARTPIEKVPGMVLTEDPVAADAVQSVENRLPDLLSENVEKHVNIMFEGLNRGQTVYGIVYVEMEGTASATTRKVQL